MAATYNYWLVFVSVLVAVLASYTALDLVTRITVSRGRAARAWLVGGAFSMGIGIWSMHFVGMLAFHLPIPMGYDVPTTLLSMLIAIVVSGFALFMVSRDTFSGRNLVFGGVLMGLGICSMHYTGMAAMETYPPIEYDPMLFSASVAIAIAAAFAALWIAFTLRAGSDRMKFPKVAAAVVMGFAITGMHYTGMAAARFHPDTVCLTGALVDNSWMAGTIAGTTFIVLCITLGLSLMDARAAERSARMAASLQQANDELKRLALHDPLTKLPNRLLLEDRIEQAVAHAARGSLTSALLFVDLDRFKLINDSLGHFTGDALLRAVAARLQTLVRTEDTVSRLGGDEFVMLLREVADLEDAIGVASKVLASLREAFRVHEQELFVTSSIGISVFPLHGDNAQTLITRADAAMYNAKQGGRNNFRVFAADMSTFFPERLMLENDLRRALGRGELELHYQPKIDVADGSMVGMEALVRWRHPQNGLIAPQDFIPLAESLSYLKRFPIDKLKIDRSFIRDISSDMDDAAIVRATIGLAHNLRLKVIAEGVETADQLEFLRALGCDEYQGFYKSGPLMAADFEHALRAELQDRTVHAIAS